MAEYFDVVSGQPAISALWTTAEEMGRLAGINMAGGSLKYHGFLATMNATEIIGIPFISVGLIEPDDNECEVFVDDRIDSYRKLAFRDDRLARITSYNVCYTKLLRYSNTYFSRHLLCDHVHVVLSKN